MGYLNLKSSLRESVLIVASEREKMAEKTPVLYNLTIGEDEEKEKKKINVEKKKEVAKVEVKKVYHLLFLKLQELFSKRDKYFLNYLIK